MTDSSSHHHSFGPTGRSLAAVILAAGKGTRMNSDLPKVLHAVAGRAMVWWVVAAAREAGASRIVVVIGHGGELVRDVFEGDDADLEFVVQEQQLGTGHATRCAEGALADFTGDVLVLAGDGPLIRPATISAMWKKHVETNAAATLATSVIPDPTGYGRVVRDDVGRFAAIVEHKEATDEQRMIREVFPSYSCFRAEDLFEQLQQLPPNESSGEYHLTDVPSMLLRAGRVVELIEAVPPEDVLSINTPEQLAEVDAILSARMEVIRK